MTNEIKNSPLGFARGAITIAPSRRHHNSTGRCDISIRHYFEINIGTVCMPCGMMISIDHNPDDIFSVENEIV